MSKKDEKNIERFFRKAADQYDADVGFRDEDWRKIEKMLDDESARNTAIRNKWKIGGGVAAVVVMVALLWYFLSGNQSSMLTEKGVPATKNTESSISSDGNVEDENKNFSNDTHHDQGDDAPSGMTAAEDESTAGKGATNNDDLTGKPSETENTAISDETEGGGKNNSKVDKNRSSQQPEESEKRITDNAGLTNRNVNVGQGVNQKSVSPTNGEKNILPRDKATEEKSANAGVMNESRLDAGQLTGNKETTNREEKDNNLNPERVNPSSVTVENKPAILLEDKKSIRDGSATVLADENSSDKKSIDSGVNLNSSQGDGNCDTAVKEKTSDSDQTHNRNKVIGSGAVIEKKEVKNSIVTNEGEGAGGIAGSRDKKSNAKNGNDSSIADKKNVAASENAGVALRDSLKEKEAITEKEKDQVGRQPGDFSSILHDKNRPASMWSFALLAAPDFSATGLSGYTKPGWAYGITVQYQPLRKFGIVTGLFRSNKVYVGAGEDYHVSKDFWRLKANDMMPAKIDGSCMVLEVPLSVRYNLMEVEKNLLYMSAGISSYLMKNQNYDFTYPQENPGAVRNWNSQKLFKYYFDIGSFSIGYERLIKPDWSVGVEPYLKVPLKGIGWAKIDLFSTGVYATLRYRILRKKTGDLPVDNTNQ